MKWPNLTYVSKIRTSAHNHSHSVPTCWLLAEGSWLLAAGRIRQASPDTQPFPVPDTRRPLLGVRSTAGKRRDEPGTPDRSLTLQRLGPGTKMTTPKDAPCWASPPALESTLRPHPITTWVSADTWDCVWGRQAHHSSALPG